MYFNRIQIIIAIKHLALSLQMALNYLYPHVLPICITSTAQHVNYLSIPHYSFGLFPYIHDDRISLPLSPLEPVSEHFEAFMHNEIELHLINTSEIRL
jgi:hypothetical protein